MKGRPEGVGARSAAWIQYFDALKDALPLFRAEAEVFVANLVADFSLGSAARVLDFGCGLGRVAALLAPRVQHLFYWDASPQMRAATANRLAGAPNCSLLDPGTSAGPPREVHFVIVNSVVQYMSAAELRQWLPRWRDLLAKGGRIIVSDILPTDARAMSSVTESILFARRQGFLLSSVLRSTRELARYYRVRASATLFHLDVATLEEWALAVGLTATRWPRNLTYRGSRMTVVFAGG